MNTATLGKDMDWTIVHTGKKKIKNMIMKRSEKKGKGNKFIFHISFFSVKGL